MTEEKKAKKQYRDEHISCPLCSRSFKSPQALSGHLHFYHALTPKPGEVGELISNPDDSIPRLKEQVEKLKLQSERERLLAGKAREPSYPDLAQISGLGELTPEVKQALQQRSFAITEQKLGFLDQLLANPELLKIVMNGLKSTFGNDSHGDNTLAILQSLGIDLKELIQNRNAPKFGDFTVAGVNLAGSAMTPEVLIQFLKWQESRENALAQQKAEQEKSRLYEDMGTNLFKLLGEHAPEIREGIKSSLSGIGENKIAAGRSTLSCPLCGNNINVAGIQLGTSVECPKCHSSWDLAPGEGQAGAEPSQLVLEPFRCASCGKVLDVTDWKPGGMYSCVYCGQPILYEGQKQVVAEMPISAKIPPKRRKAKQADEGRFVRCSNCDQVLDVSNVALGQSVTCPTCGTIQKLEAPDMPVQPLPVKEEGS